MLLTLPFTVMIDYNCKGFYEREDADNMYKIGELSALCRIPVKTLRFYDSEGILTPVYIDNFTGYRYYSAAQLSDCYKIVKLKELGFTLSEIRRFLSADQKGMQELLAEKELQLSTEKLIVENRIHVLHELNLSLKESESMYNIVVRKSEPINVAYTRKLVNGYYQCDTILEQMHLEIGPEKIGERAVFIEYGTEYNEQCMDVGLGIEVKGKIQSSASYSIRTISFDDETVNLICTKDNYTEAIDAVNNFLAKNDYQTVGPRYRFIYKDGTNEIKIPVVKLGEFNPKYREDVDIPFENDPVVVGRWKLISCVADAEQFNPDCVKTPDMRNLVKDLYFLPGGEKYWVFSWTKGYLLSHGISWPARSNKNQYEVRYINGKEYLFIWFKAHNYYLGGKPEVWVLENVDHESHTKKEISFKDEIPDLPADDRNVIGTWEVCGLLSNPEEFIPGQPGNFPPESLYWRKAVFSPDGSLTNTFGTLASGKTDIIGAPVLRWVNGYAVNTKISTTSEYIFREIDGVTYLFIQWKSGDYLYGGEVPFWYVFKHVDGDASV